MRYDGLRLNSIFHCNIASQTSGSKRSLQDTFATHSSGSTASTLDPNKNLTDKMREALISVFQNFYDTKEISGLREFFETQLTSTKAQMTLTEPVWSNRCKYVPTSYPLF